MRITEKDLKIAVERLNDMAPKSKFGAFVLDAAYGGWRLDQYINPKSTAIRTVSGCGYVPKRELYNWMQAYMSGMESN
jgi:hypothetical protein